ncbi:hypothetical protein O181_130589 [Austropuccinia psidii MF-1]|uniref:Uncharacterized protein n=1 Tax=Austropuccinia psidii MF-1 TaxID=1389203 RepID=A0A9Q3L446_9BASI|nr:hypothetical protein [Austropuccinia psidii MF-1]
MAFLGHLGPLRLLWPLGRNSRSVGQLGPFWPNAMRPKGAKGGNHLAPKARWVPNHNSQFLAINPLETKMAIEPIGPNFGHGPTWTIIPTMASGNHQRPPDQLRKHCP